jgi:hypothetical protein
VERPTIDPKRTGVKATMIPWTEPPMELVNDRWHGPLGAFIQSGAPEHWTLCCPGCGELGSPRDGAVWSVTSGSWDDVSTLTLSPSIAKNCCGWHGFLRHGVFESC